MQPVLPLRNPIRDYAWGSRTALAELLGRPPAAEPQAELWLGAHPSAPSEVHADEGSSEGAWHRLDRWIEEHRETVLGAEVARRWGHLPFLMKVLAAARPLSIQAHPDAEQARAGFAAEESAGVPRDAAWRNYPDDRHKPEIIYALTDFSLLRGFREPADALARLRRVGLGESELAAALDTSADAGSQLRSLLEAFLGLDAEAANRHAETALTEVARRGPDDVPESWLPRLAEEYGHDRGVLAPLFLHLLTLAPGEAMFTGAGVLHAYLEGLGIEVMASSDNVLRGALTAKHVDPAELLGIVRYQAGEPRLAGSERSGVEQVFTTPADDFRLSILRLGDGGDGDASGEGAWHHVGRGVQILLCTDGEGVLRAAGREVTFARGDSFLVPDATGGFEMAGRATVFRAAVGL